MSTLNITLQDAHNPFVYYNVVTDTSGSIVKINKSSDICCDICCNEETYYNCCKCGCDDDVWNEYGRNMCLSFWILIFILMSSFIGYFIYYYERYGREFNRNDVIGFVILGIISICFIIGLIYNKCKYGK